MAKPVTVVGVMPASFDFGGVFAPGMKVDIFVPAIMDFWRTWGNTMAMVRHLKPGVGETLAQSRDETDRLFPHLKSLHPDSYEDYASDLVTLKDHVSGQLRQSLVLLWSAVGVILLIVCVNLSSLQLGRATTRSKELAMRRALGASRGRVIRQLLAESIVLSLAGAALGLFLAYGIVFYIAHQTFITLPLLGSIHLDAAALAWTLLIGLGRWPPVRPRAGLQNVQRESSRRAEGQRKRAWPPATATSVSAPRWWSPKSPSPASCSSPQVFSCAAFCMSSISTSASNPTTPPA